MNTAPDVQQDLHQNLRAMIAMIKDKTETSVDGLSMVQHLQRIDQLKENLEGEAPPMLMHFLEKRSYTKALDFLEGRDETQKPNC